MEYQFGWFPRPKYRDLVFYVKADQGMNVSLFDLPDTEENRAIIGALIGPADEITALREENARKDEALEALRYAIDRMPKNGHTANLHNIIDDALASARPAPAQEQGEEMRKAIGSLVAAWDVLRAGEDHSPRSVADWLDQEMAPAIARARALLARKPAEISACPACGRPWDMSKYTACQCGASLARKPNEERGAAYITFRNNCDGYRCGDDHTSECPHFGKPAEERGPEVDHGR